MSRPFTLPVVIACSAHALLMFGFKKPEVVVKPDTIACAKPVIDFPLPVPLEEPPEITPPAGESAAGVKPSAPPPAVPETPPSKVSFGEITMDPTWNENRHVAVKTDIIPSGPYAPGGDREGVSGPGGGGNGIVFGPTALDNTPRTRVQTPPSYPLSLKSSGISGEVVVEFTVDERGRVLNPRVLRSTHPDFESPTLSAVSKWRFEPGTRNMAPVRFKMVVPVKFNLND